MQCTLRPLRNPQLCIDVRTRLVEAIAAELTRYCGGSEQLNLLEAEAQLDALLGDTDQLPLIGEPTTNPR